MTSIEQIFINDMTELESKLSGIETDLESKSKDLLSLTKELPELEGSLEQLAPLYNATCFTESEKQKLTETLNCLMSWSETSLALLPSIKEQQSKNKEKLQDLESNTEDLKNKLTELTQTLETLKSNVMTKSEAIELENFLTNSLKDLEMFASDINKLESQLWKY